MRAAADQDEVLRHRARTEPPHAALEADRRDVVQAAAVRAAADLDARAVGRGNQLRPFAQVLLEQPAEAARLCHRQLAGLRPRTARDVGDRPRFGEPEPRRRKPAIELAHVTRADPAEEQVLIGRDADRAVAVGPRQLAEHPHLIAGEIAERHGGDRHHVAELLLRPDVGRVPPRVDLVAGLEDRHDRRRQARARDPAAGHPRRDVPDRRRRVLHPLGPRFAGRRIDFERRHLAAQAARGQFAIVLLAPARPAEGLDQELHAVALLVLVVAQPFEHPQHRLGDAQDLRGRQELVQQPGRGRHDRGAAAGGDAEAAAAVRPGDRAEAEIVDPGRDVIGGAALEGDLELARQRRAERVAQQVAGQRLRVRRDVEPLVGGNAGVRAGGDVAHRAAARLPGGQPRVGEAAHRRLDVVQLDEMKLHVLPGGDVAEAARVALADVGERLELLAGQDALRDLDPQHLRVFRLALAVGAAHQPERAPLVGRHLAALVALERRHEFVDVGLAREREPRAPEGLGIVNDRHMPSSFQ